MDECIKLDCITLETLQKCKKILESQKITNTEGTMIISCIQDHISELMKSLVTEWKPDKDGNMRVGQYLIMSNPPIRFKKVTMQNYISNFTKEYDIKCK